MTQLRAFVREQACHHRRTLHRTLAESLTHDALDCLQLRRAHRFTIEMLPDLDHQIPFRACLPFTFFHPDRLQSSRFKVQGSKLVKARLRLWPSDFRL